MAAGRYSIVIEQGATFELSVVYKDSTGAAIDLSNYGARMQVRSVHESNTVLVSLTTTLDSDGSGITITGVSGSIYVRLSAASSSNLSFSTGVYDLEIYSGSGNTEYVQRILEGKVKLSKQATR